MSKVAYAGKTVSVFRKKFINKNHFDSFEKLDEVIKLDVKCTITKHLRKEHMWYQGNFLQSC